MWLYIRAIRLWTILGRSTKNSQKTTSSQMFNYSSIWMISISQIKFRLLMTKQKYCTIKCTKRLTFIRTGIRWFGSIKRSSKSKNRWTTCTNKSDKSTNANWLIRSLNRSGNTISKSCSLWSSKPKTTRINCRTWLVSSMKSTKT